MCSNKIDQILRRLTEVKNLKDLTFVVMVVQK